jgi:tetratricopeptide (TPR) repeat protein
MIQNEAIDMILDALLERNLGEAITAAENFLAVHPHQISTDRLNALKSDYQLMVDYWRRGYKDPQIPALYDRMLQRMYVLYATIAGSYGIRHSPFLNSLYMKVHTTPRDWSPQVIMENLEAFVSDVALAGLERRPTAELYAQHHREMVELFDYILTSGVWSDGFARAMEDIVLSPTVDTNDQQLIVSSVMLATMNMFDMAKFRMMAHVYQKAVDEQVRQRALIGWALSMDSALGLRLYPEEVELVQKMVEDENCCRELVELQKQLVFCLDAERDHQTIQQEIMPNILNQQGFHLNRNGVIEEIENDELNDILHPDAEEEKLERLEQSFQKMMDMQKQGSDIYFGGFSQMKRFPFFNELMNWFVPFYKDHPDISEAIGQYGSNRFLNSLFSSGPFCTSDKYSFLLAFNQVVSRLPDNLRQMMEQGEIPMAEVGQQEQDRPAYIRRTYLMDIYRFCRLFPNRNAFRNVFEIESGFYIILSSPIFTSTHVEAYFNEVTAFLIKRKHLEEAVDMLANYGENRRDFQYYLMSAIVGRQTSARENYEKALELKPDHVRALSGYARVLFNEGEYQKALDVYDKLLSLQPDKKSYLLNKAVCLTNLQRCEEAEKVLFRLNYDAPDDVNVNRVLAWTLTNDGKYEQAEKLYSQLLTGGNNSADDLLNYGYCLWFAGHIDEAADCFHRYLKESGDEKESIIKNELDLIRRKGITEAEIQMMLYIL